MAQILNLSDLSSGTRPSLHEATGRQSQKRNWSSLQQALKCNGKFTCLFSGSNNREEQARKALEGALGGKKDEFEKWNKEIKKREEISNGGSSGGGGWFGSGGGFGWFNGDNFWPEAQQTSLAVVGIVLVYLIVAKGDAMLALIFNPLLYALRGVRNTLSTIPLKLARGKSADEPTRFAERSSKEVYGHPSAKENVLRKWGSD